MIMKSFPNKWMSNKIKEAFMCENYESTYTSGSTSERMQIVRPKDWWKGEYKRTANYNKYLMQKEINNWKKLYLLLQYVQIWLVIWRRLLTRKELYIIPYS